MWELHIICLTEEGEWKYTSTFACQLHMQLNV